MLKASGEGKMSRLYVLEKKGEKMYLPKGIVFFTGILSDRCLVVSNTYLEGPDSF